MKHKQIKNQIKQEILFNLEKNMENQIFPSKLYFLRKYFWVKMEELNCQDLKILIKKSL